MTKRMLQAMILVVKALGGEHMPVVFTDKISFVHIGRDIFFLLHTLVLAIVYKIIIGIDIL